MTWVRYHNIIYHIVSRISLRQKTPLCSKKYVPSLLSATLVIYGLVTAGAGTGRYLFSTGAVRHCTQLDTCSMRRGDLIRQMSPPGRQNFVTTLNANRYRIGSRGINSQRWFHPVRTSSDRRQRCHVFIWKNSWTGAARGRTHYPIH